MAVNKDDEEKIRFGVIGGLGGLVLGLLIGFSINGGRPVAVADQGTSTPNSSQVATETKKAFEKKTITGTGSSAENTVDLPAGVYIVKSTNTGDSNFIVHLTDRDSGATEYIVNEVGSYTGSTALTVARNTRYILNVDSKGSWTVEISQ